MFMDSTKTWWNKTNKLKSSLSISIKNMFKNFFLAPTPTLVAFNGFTMDLSQQHNMTQH